MTGSHTYASSGPVILLVTVTSGRSFLATLAGTSEVPPTASPGSGLGTVVVDHLQTQITVDLSFSGLTAPATAAHIHTAPAGTNGGVTFPLAGVPGATAGAIPEQVFAITPAQYADLVVGNQYMNVHTSPFPGGEIRGQLGPEVQSARGQVVVGDSVPVLGEVGLAALMLAVLAVGLAMLRRLG